MRPSFLATPRTTLIVLTPARADLMWDCYLRNPAGQWSPSDPSRIERQTHLVTPDMIGAAFSR